MGCIYTGMKTSRSVNGFFKVGMTEDTKPTRRFKAYDLTGLIWVYCPNATKTQLLYLESVARLKAEQIGMTLQGNDCFWYSIDKSVNKYNQAYDFALQVMQEVADECDRLRIKYECFRYL